MPHLPIRVSVLGLLATTLLVSPALGELYLNEAVIRGTERVEIYSSEVAVVDLTGWRISGSDGDFLIPDNTMINPGQYLVFDDLADIFDNLGGAIDLIDDLDTGIDHVDYGQLGGAPLPHDENDVSMSRSPDGALGPPIDPANDALFWTLEFVSSFGVANDAPNPDLGSSLVINEINTNPAGFMAGDEVELYNPTGGPIDGSTGWKLTFGAGPTVPFTLSIIPPGGFGVIALPASIEIETAGLVYLFNGSEVRVDQLGITGGALRGESGCFSRCPDGIGPNDGYDGPTSGGGVSLFELGCTIGQTNGEDCGASPVERSSWGRIKAGYRD